MTKAPSKVSDKRVDMNAPHDIVVCEVCLTEVPADMAKTFDGPDYVLYFCGLDCLGEWRAKHGEPSREVPTGKP